MKPILFNTEMVRAILDGRKTTTRRRVRKKYSNTDLMMFTNKYGTRLIEQQNDAPKPIEFIDEDGVKRTRCSLIAYVECKLPYQPGDILYVRETWGISNLNERESTMIVQYKTDDSYGTAILSPDKFQKYYERMSETEPDWHPSIHMPKEAARIFLRVKGVRAERLQNITDEEAENEGCTDATSTAMGFFDVWDSTIKKSDRDKYGWNANPWVWVISFEQCKKPEDGK